MMLMMMVVVVVVVTWKDTRSQNEVIKYSTNDYRTAVGLGKFQLKLCATAAYRVGQPGVSAVICS